MSSQDKIFTQLLRPF